MRRRSSQRGRFAKSAVLSVLLLSMQPPWLRAATIDEVGARVLFAEGRRLAAAGDYATACFKFEDSFRLDPGIGTSFNLADCFEHTDRIASAWVRFLDVAAATKAAGQPERERVARARASALEPRLARLVLAIDSPAAGLVVERDGISVVPAAWGMAIPVDPGDHVIEVVAPGRKKWSTKVTVPDTPITVSLSVPVLEVLPKEGLEPRPEAQTPASTAVAAPLARNHRGSMPAFVLGSAGTLVLATGAVFAVKFQLANGEAKTLCKTNICGNADEKARHDTLVEDARLDRTLAFVGAGVGGAMLLTAAYLWWRPTRASPGNTGVGRVSGQLLATPTLAFGQLEVGW